MIKKTLGGENFITTSVPNEIVAADLLYLNHKEFIVTYVDFYTRLPKTKLITSKDTINVKDILQEFINELGTPKKLITDPGTELDSQTIKTWCLNNNIQLHLTSSEKHQSNGRIKRIDRNIWQGIRKLKLESTDKTMDQIVHEIEESYNNTLNRSIKMSPNEAWNFPEN